MPKVSALGLMLIIQAKTTYNMSKNTFISLIRQVKKILLIKGYSFAFNLTDFNDFYKLVGNDCNSIVDAFIVNTSQHSDLDQYTF